MELAQLRQLLVSGSVVTEEELLISGVGLHPLPHAGGVEQSQIRGQLEQVRVRLLLTQDLLEVAGVSKCRGGRANNTLDPVICLTIETMARSDITSRGLPALDLPVVEEERFLGPGTLKARAVTVGTAEGMGCTTIHTFHNTP